MNRVLIVVALALSSVAVAAQDAGWIRGGCTNCFVVSYVDQPWSSDVSVAPMNVWRSQGFYAAGWGFLCEQGLATDRVDVWYQKDDGFYAPLLQTPGSLYWGLNRPDVQKVYAPWCPGLGQNTGWHLYVTNLPPAGVRNMVFIVWQGPYHQNHYRTIVVR